MAYHLDCADCQFATMVEGDVEDVYDRIDEHRDEQEPASPEHFVEIRRTSAD